ncbi:hypothetical protein Tco_0053021 [Tanacetum coccineum]
MAPRAVLMKTGLKSFNLLQGLLNCVRSVNTGRPFSTARSSNTVRPFYTAHPKSTIHYARPKTYFQNQAQSTIHRPFSKITAFTKRCFNQRVVDHVSKNISASVTLKRLDYIDAQGRFKSVMAWIDAQIQGRQECSKEKEGSREECSKSRKTKKMNYYCWLKITAVGEKVNAAESLLVVSTEVRCGGEGDSGGLIMAADGESRDGGAGWWRPRWCDVGDGGSWRGMWVMMLVVVADCWAGRRSLEVAGN